MEEKDEDMKEDMEDDTEEEEEEEEDMEESECDVDEKKLCRRAFNELKEKEKVSTEAEESMNKHLPDASVEIYEPLLCHAVRIGSFKVNPATNTSFIYINLAVNEMSFNASMVTDKNKIVPITLKPCDITKMTYHFKRSLPIIFIFTTPSFAEALRKSLGMSSSSYAYFDPNSNDVTQNKITFLIDTLNDDQRRFLQHVFLPDNKVVELGRKTADEILIKPKAFPNTSNGSISRRRTAAALINRAELATSIRPATKANLISASRITGGNDKSYDQYFGGTGMHSKPPKEKDSVKEKEEEENMTKVDFNVDEKKEELHSSEVDESEVPPEDHNEIHKPLLCRSIRIGSLKIFPEFKMSFINVYLAMDGISFKGLVITDKNKVVTITLKPCDITKMMVHFGKCLPIIFVFTTSSFAERLKKSLNVPSAYVYFDPNSSDETREKITFLVDIVNDDQRQFLRHNFLPENRVMEIDQKTANEILVKSTPQAGQYLKLQMPLQEVQISTEPQLNVTPIQHTSDKDAFRKICHSCKSVTNNPKFCHICKCNLSASVQGERQNTEVPQNRSGTSYEAVKKITKMEQIIVQPHNDIGRNKNIQTVHKQMQEKTSSVIWAKRRAKLQRKQNRSSAREKSSKRLPVKTVTTPEDNNMKSSEDDNENGGEIFNSLISVFSSNRAGLTITPILPATSTFTSTLNTNSVSRVTGERLLKNDTLL